MNSKFDIPTQAKINALRRKELFPKIIKFVMIVFLPAALLSFLIGFVPALEERNNLVLFIQNFLVLSIIIGVLYTIICMIKKQYNLLSFNKRIDPDTNTQGVIYKHHVITLNNRGDKAAYVKVVVSNMNEFMYCVVPLEESYQAGETVEVSYDSKTPKTCIVSRKPDFSVIEKNEIE